MRSSPRTWQRLPLPTSIAAIVVVALDLGSKAWAVAQLLGRPPIVVIPTWLRFELAVNPGVAFGVLGTTGVVPTLLALFVVLYLLWLATHPVAQSRVPAVAVGLMLGGALGNLYDRLFRQVDDPSLWGFGHKRGVIDFIAVHRWPAFNLADVALVLGAAVLIASLARGRLARRTTA